MIEAGRYKGKKVGELQFGHSSKGNDQIAVELKLTSGQTVTAFLSFSEAARPYSEDRLMALGWGGPGNLIDENKLTNEVDVDISYRTWEGKEQMSVDIVTGGGRAKLKNTMDPAQKAAFMARIAGTGAAKSAPKLDF